MGVSQIFVALFAIVSIVVSILAIWRVATTSRVEYKPLWIGACLFGFVGFATSMNVPGDLYLEFGIQVPVLMVWFTGNGVLVCKPLFPIVAAVALVRFYLPSTRASG